MAGWSGDSGLAALFAAAFVSATLLPANSELVLAALLHAHPDIAATAVAVATVGNTLGGLTTYGIGRLLPRRTRIPPAALARVRRFGALALLFSWVPVAGDALCAAAGWLRIPFVPSALAMAAGKLARYAAIAWLLSA